MKKIAPFVVAALVVLAAVFITVTVENKKINRLEAENASLLEDNRREINSLNEELQALKDDHQADKEILTALFRKVDYKDEPVYVIGHKSPDFDTTASAIGMAYLLGEFGIRAEAKVTGSLNLETEYGLSAIGYPAPEILESAAGKQLWLVDHSDSKQMVNGAEEARIVGITDHHGIGDVENAEPINILSCPAGSTSAIVFTLCVKCDVELPQDIAKVLLAGILSDTANMKGKNVTVMDEVAFSRLKQISGISDTDALFNGMLEAKLSYKGMDDREIFYSDYKEYEANGFSYAIGVVKVASTDKVPAMSERMLQVIESEAKSRNDMDFLLFEVYDPDYSLGYIGFYGKDMEFAKKVVDTVFGDSGEKQGDFYAFSPSPSRKSDVVPPLNNYLNTLKAPY